MTIDEYGEWAASAARAPGETRAERIAYFALGLLGEAGEVADNLRKMMRGTPDERYLAYELGDILFHWTCLVAELGQTPSAMLDQSRANIEARLAARPPST